MVKTSRLYEKTFKKKFRGCVFQLKSMLMANGVVSRQKILLHGLLEELRTQPMLDSENSSNVEVKNMWGQRDMQTLLKERSDRIYSLEAELEEMRSEQAVLAEERKRMRMDALVKDCAQTYEQLVVEKNKEVVEKTAEVEMLRIRLREFEAEQQTAKEGCEALREANKRLLEMTGRKASPAFSRDILQEIRRYLDIEQELCKQRSAYAELEQQLASAKEESAGLQTRLKAANDLLGGLETMKVIHLDQPDETGLMEELENTIAAYDKLVETSKQLEESHSTAVKRVAESEAENISLKIRIKALEDTKQYLDREKRRLNEWRDSLLEETRILEEKIEGFEMLTADRDKKMGEYKMLLTTLEANVKVLESEAASANNSNRSAQGELLALRREVKTLQLEHEDTRRLNETYKGICLADVNVVEEIEKYKRILRCSLCDTNIKNSVISKCMHTFCDLCLTERIRSRQRKCPSCQIEFNSNDIKKIYF